MRCRYKFCHATNDLVKAVGSGEGTCNTPCGGDGAQMCGGDCTTSIVAIVS